MKKIGQYHFIEKSPWFMKSEEMTSLHIAWYDVIFINTHAKNRIKHRWVIK